MGKNTQLIIIILHKQIFKLILKEKSSGPYIEDSIQNILTISLNNLII